MVELFLLYVQCKCLDGIIPCFLVCAGFLCCTLYFDEKKEKIKYYTNYSVRAYIEPAIKYWLKRHLKTMYDNNSPDSVGLLAELELAGNQKTELI